jgi:hypothetical protein
MHPPGKENATRQGGALKTAYDADNVADRPHHCKPAPANVARVMESLAEKVEVRK